MPGSQKVQVLIIEDEKAIANALQLKLEREGFQVTHVMDGQEGLEIAKKGGFPIILLDLVMPNMDGFTFLEEIKKEQINSTILVLSNLSQQEDENRALALGASGFFIKSNVPVAEVVEKVKEMAH